MIELGTFRDDGENGLADMWEVITTSWQLRRRNLLRSYGITANQFAVIRAVAVAKRQHAPNQQFVVRHTGINKMVVSRTLDTLERKRLLWRIRAFIDTRQHTIRLGAGGKLLLESITPELRALETEFLGPLTVEDRVQLKKLLIKLVVAD